METFRNWLTYLKDLFDFPIIKIGETTITIWSFFFFLVLLVLLYYAAGKIRRLLVERVLTRSHLDAGARAAVGAITRYLVLFVGSLIIMQTVGINLTTLNVLAGAVGIGVGFGLQNIASNFISGLIILFERPIKVGDRIEVNDVDGDVVEVGARSTVVRTNDNITIIVPNSKFVTESVVNWNRASSRVRFRIPVGVAYGSDAREVESLLLEVAHENENVMREPPPKVWFNGFGQSSLDFVLLAWNSTHIHRKGQFISDLNFAIYEKFNQHGIEIPFPQSDLHIRSINGGALEIKPDSTQPEPAPERRQRRASPH
jgi:small-conductance mechanosensitive channel